MYKRAYCLRLASGVHTSMRSNCPIAFHIFVIRRETRVTYDLKVDFHWRTTRKCPLMNHGPQ